MLLSKTFFHHSLFGSANTLILPSHIHLDCATQHINPRDNVSVQHLALSNRPTFILIVQHSTSTHAIMSLLSIGSYQHSFCLNHREHTSLYFVLNLSIEIRYNRKSLNLKKGLYFEERTKISVIVSKVELDIY